MKKNFTAPEMSLSMFDMEDIVTTSAATPFAPVTTTETTEEVFAKTENQVTVDYNSFGFTF